LEKLLEVKTCKPGKLVNLGEDEIKYLILQTKAIFTEQPVLLEIEAPLNIVGDIHGQ